MDTPNRAKAANGGVTVIAFVKLGPRPQNTMTNSRPTNGWIRGAVGA
jgi:hypothetical protein